MTNINAAILANETLTPAELVQILRVSPSSIGRGLRNGTIPHFSINRRVMIPSAWLRALLNPTVAA
jgi:hypothetical protein